MNPTSILAFGLPGGIEWVIVLVIGLLLFGRRLPEIMRGLGGGVREFRKGIEGQEEPPSAPPAQPPAEQTKVEEPAEKSDS